MKMKKDHIIRIALFLAIILCVINIQAQIRVGGHTAPNRNAVLDLNANDTAIGSMGLLLPRVALTATSNPSPLTMHVAGMQVYNTATSGDVTPGIYYNNGAKWMRLIDIEHSPDDGKTPIIVAPTERHIEIELNETITTQSKILHGITDPLSTELVIVNIKPIFENDINSRNLLTVTPSARLADDGKSVHWRVRIQNNNIFEDGSITLKSVVVSYFCIGEDLLSKAEQIGGSSSTPAYRDPHVKYVNSTKNTVILVGQ